MRSGMELWCGLEQARDTISNLRVGGEAVTTILTTDVPGHLGCVAMEQVEALYAGWPAHTYAHAGVLGKSVDAWRACDGAIGEIRLSESVTADSQVRAVFIGMTASAETACRPVIEVKVGLFAATRRIVSAHIGFATQEKERALISRAADLRYLASHILLARNGRQHEIPEHLQPLAAGCLLQAFARTLSDLKHRSHPA